MIKKGIGKELMSNVCISLQKDGKYLARMIHVGEMSKNEYVNVYIRIHNIIQTILLSNAIIRTKYLQMIT